jgi:hypothetical protein
VPDEQLKSLYSPAFLAEVAEEFDIPNHAGGRFGEAVLGAGAVYKQLKAMSDGRPTPPEVQKHFELIEHHASSLLALLQDMDDASWNYFSRAEQDLQEECVFQRTSPAMLEIGALTLVDDERDHWTFYTRDDFPPVLKLAALYAQRARATIPAPRRGPKSQRALRQWTRSLCDLWVSLGKPVTVDQANPGSSATFRFLEALLRKLDEEAVESLPNVLREERTRRRRRN